MRRLAPLPREDPGAAPWADALHACRDLLAGAWEMFHSASLDQILDTTAFMFSRVLDASFVLFIWKSPRAPGELRAKGYDAPEAGLAPGNAFLTPLEPLLPTLTDGRPRLFTAFANDFFHYVDTGGAGAAGMRGVWETWEQIRPELVIPLLSRTGLYGVLLLGARRAGGPYNEAELAYGEQLVSFASQAMQTFLHYEQSLRDLKTGLYNSTFFRTRLEEELSRAAGAPAAYASSVVMLDVDRFKRFNDDFGHLAGDRILESLAGAIKQGIRTADVPARFGGEEFTLLLPRTGAEAALLVAERLRRKIRALDIPWTPPLPPVTVSAGVFTFTGGTNLTPDEALRRVDLALYRSKNQGGDRATPWTEGAAPGPPAAPGNTTSINDKRVVRPPTGLPSKSKDYGKPKDKKT